MSVVFYQPEVETGVHQLDHEEAHHCVRVLRKRVGDIIEVMDGKGHFYQAELTSTGKSVCSFKILSSSFQEASSQHIHLAIAPTKNIDRTEWMVEKCVEIGVDEISFLQCDNSERSRIRFDRLAKKALSATKQSRRKYIPTLHETLTPFSDFLDLEVAPYADTRSVAMAHVNEDQPYKELRTWKPLPYALVLIGPEGDFSPDEVKLALEAGAQLVSLGENRLRTETAGIAAVLTLTLKFE